MNSSAEWPTVLLERLIVDIQSGFAQQPDTRTANIPQLRTNNVSPDGVIDLSEIKYVHATASQLEQFGVHRGDVIFNNTNSVEWVGKTAFFDRDGTYVLSNHMTRIRVDTALLDAEFLARYLHYLWHNGTARRWAKIWVNQAAIDQADLGRFPINLPPLSEQRRIATILHQADDLRRLRREADGRTRDLLPALFKEMFGMPLTWTNNVLLEKAVDFIGGGTPERKIKHYFTGNIPWATPKDIKVQYLDDTEEHITEEAIKNSATNRVPIGTILMVVKSKILAHSLPISITTRSLCFGQDLKGLVCKAGFLPKFVATAIQVQSQHILKSARGANTEGLTLDILRDVRLPDVEPDMQQQFVLRAAVYDNIISNQETIVLSLNNFFHSLVALSLAGKLTAIWREQHTEELLKEMAQRDTILADRGQQVTSVSEEEQQSQGARNDANTALRGFRRALVGAARLQQDTGGASPPQVSVSSLEGMIGEVYTDTLAVLPDDIPEGVAARINFVLAQTTTSFFETARAESRLTRYTKQHHRVQALQNLLVKHYQIYLLIASAENYVTAQSLETVSGLAPVDVRRALELLVAAGLAIEVSLPARPTGRAIYVPAYRAVRPARDDAREEDLAFLTEITR